jgi:protein-tyrosine phosphatase
MMQWGFRLLHKVLDHLYRFAIGVPQLRRSQITPDIFVGGQYSTRGLGRLRLLGITAVVNMRTRLDFTAEEVAPLRLLHLPTIDQTPPTLEQLETGAAFIANELTKGGKVYIHCRWGEGRGPTMALAYFISIGMTLDQAVQLVRQGRSFINPTVSQMEQLARFADRMRSRL